MGVNPEKIQASSVNAINGGVFRFARYNGMRGVRWEGMGLRVSEIMHGEASDAIYRSFGSFAILGLAPFSIFTWQYVITHALLSNPFGSMSAYYYGRSLLALVMAFAFAKFPLSRLRWVDALSIPMTATAMMSPLLLSIVLGSETASYVICFLAGAASSWLYLRVFLMLSRMQSLDALTLLLVELALSHMISRAGLVFVPNAGLLVLGVVLPPLCLVVVRRSLAGFSSLIKEDDARGCEAKGADRGLYRLVVADFAVYGLVAGLVRTPYETAQFDVTVSLVAAPLLCVGVALFLWWVRYSHASTRFGGVCQIILLLLLTVLLVLVLFGNADSAVAAVASLFARFGVHALLLYVLCLLVFQEDGHPYAVFGFGWGFFTLATGLGMSAASAFGISRFSAVVALGIVYVLFLVSFVAYTRMKGNDALFLQADCRDKGNDGLSNSMSSSFPSTENLTLQDIAQRCAEVGEANGLTHREIEVAQLICLGRSKSYIAESLSVTENTVRGYAKNAYRKLGIHSRQELLTLIGIG